MTFRHSILLAAVCPLLFALPGSQDPIARTSVQMVEVSIVATGPKGEPAAGLEAKDIRVWDNGKEQTIASLRRVSSVTPPDVVALPAGAFSNRMGGSHQIGKAAQPQTLSIVLLDAKNTKLRYQATVRQAVEKVLGQKPPEQRIALYALGNRLTALHDFSADKESLLAKLDGYHGEATQYNDLITDFGFADMTHKLPMDPSIPHPSVQAMIDRTRILETLKSLEAIAAHMKGVPGRKNLLWISGGIARAVDGRGQRSGTGQISTKSPYYEQFGPELKHAIAALSDANVAVYTVDARGIPAGPKSRDMAINIDAMRDIADATGGKAFYGNNDLTLGVRTALDDSREVYELTFSPRPMVADGAYHTIRLATNRAGVQLRYRQGYNAPGKEETASAETAGRLAEVVSSPLDASEIGLQASLAASDGPSLRITVRVDPADINLSPNGGKWNGALRLEAMQLGASGELLGGVQQNAELNLEPATYHRALEQGLSFHFELQRVNDAVAVRIGVVDERGDHAGSVSVALPPR